MQYTIAAMALAGFAAALPQDNYGYADYSSAPAEYPTTTTPASYPTTSEVPEYYSTSCEEEPTQYPTSSPTAPSYYYNSTVTSPAYYNSSTKSTPAYYPISTEACDCPAPGYTDSMGRYSCNPAHSYPEGQFCDLVDSCYFLRTEGPGASAIPCTSTIEQYTTYCPTPTTITAYSKTYTVTSATTLTVCPGSCVYTTASLPPPEYTTATVSQYTTVCPTPTTVYAHGQTYPVTIASQTVTVCPGGCTVTQPAMPSGSSYTCPAAGSTDSMGRYSCNPANQYPAGQTCQQVDSCYFLIGAAPSASGYSSAAPVATGAYKPSGYPANPTTPAVYTGGAAVITVAPVALLALGALFL
ncbi:hypothetical protein DOTSEDRAFT_75206 [Dothistroma septosporum NZE10]|uniref:Uncharacterized protein n=1 Tax=Dothistroma septosporum (strain NZE10 / CBS 128990) TaxID=675120 RepID=M2XJ25_DOTSN|nr:hypothetical protein DOTSEDRAFT_75206 [Dothistroma septosporum NZE10]